MLENILHRIDKNDLLFTIGHKKFDQFKKLIIHDKFKDNDDDDILLSFFFSIYGDKILYEQKIRHLVYNTIDAEKLISLSEKYCKKVYTKPYDNALELSFINWKYDSDFVIEISQYLQIEDKYLPTKEITKPAFELLEPTKKLFPLHDYQENLKNKILNELNNKSSRFLIQMPTGSGKTRTVLQSIVEYEINNKFLANGFIITWLAHTEELCEQAIETFRKIWLNFASYSINMNRFWGSYIAAFTDIKGSIIFGTFQKFYGLYNTSPSYFDLIRSNLRILIIDEAHKSTAKSYSKVINEMTHENQASLIGITATPGRIAENSKENLELSNFYDRKLISPDFKDNPIIALRKNKILSTIKRKVIKTNINFTFKLSEANDYSYTSDIPIGTLKKLSENIDRNVLLLSIIENELINNNPCIVFSCSIEHSRILSAVINQKGYKSSYIDSELNTSYRKQIISDFKNGKTNALFNYGVLSTGFDAPRVRSIIIARPTTSLILYSQMIGRGLRGPKMGGGEYCNLIDLKDNFSNFGEIEKVYSYFEDYWN